MKAKEKALELVDRFYKIPNSQGIYMMQHYQAKQCAIIAVEFAISNEYDNEGELYEENNVSYLLEVKSEIEKL